MNKFILPHEHMSIDLSGPKKNQDCQLDLYFEDKSELIKLKQQGLVAIFDCSNKGMGRNYQTLSMIENELKIPVFTGTGFYKDPFLPDYVETSSIEELEEMMIQDLTTGEEGKQASFIGEIGTSLNEWTQNEHKVFEASVLAHKETNAPILTHTTLGTLALEQIEFFKQRDVDLKRVLISHVDLKQDFNYIVQLLKEGVYVGFDTIGKLNYLSDETRLDWVMELVHLGYMKRILLSLDITRKSHLQKNGGIGYEYFMNQFIPLLANRGLSETDIEQIILKNPQDWLGVKLS